MWVNATVLELQFAHKILGYGLCLEILCDLSAAATKVMKL